MPLSPEPTSIELLAQEDVLKVDWDDGHQTRFALRYLRGFCPCAACQGHAPNSWTFVDVPQPRITKVEEVGNYAISIAWSDDHATGIYSWEVLRELCPCEVCLAQQGDEHAMQRYPN